MTFDSWSATFPTVDWTQTSIASISTLDSSTGVTWSTTDGPECKLLELWASKTACHGISGPWAMAKSNAPTAQAEGQFVMYHWLADKKPLDATKVFQIEAGFTVNLLINEHVAPFATDANLAIAKSGWTNGGSDASGYNLLCSSSSAVENWAYGSFVFDGASTLIGASAALAAVAAAFF